MALEGEDVTGALFGDQGTGGEGGQGGGQGDGGQGDGGQGGGGEGGGQGGGEGEGGGGFQAPDWFEKVSADAAGSAPSNRDWLTSKGMKDLDTLVKSYREAENTIRNGNKGLTVPGEGAKPEEVAAYRTAIGVPERADGYEVNAPKGVTLNEPLIAAMREAALKHGAPKGAFEGLIGDYIQAQMDEAAQLQAEQNKQVGEKLKEWGASRAENETHINAAARALGFTRDDMAWMRTMPGGAGRALDLMVKLGSGMAEDVMMTGGKGRFGISGAEAQKELDALKADQEFQAKNKPGTPERARWDRLNQAASEWTAAQAQAA